MEAADADQKQGVTTPNLPINGFRLLFRTENGWRCQVRLPNQYPDRVTAEVLVPEFAVLGALHTSVVVRGWVGGYLVWHKTDAGYFLGSPSTKVYDFFRPAPPKSVWDPTLFELPVVQARAEVMKTFELAYWTHILTTSYSRKQVMARSGHASQHWLVEYLRLNKLAHLLPPPFKRTWRDKRAQRGSKDAERTPMAIRDAAASAAQRGVLPDLPKRPQ